MTQKSRVLLYLLRRDLRLSDSPIFHHLATCEHQYTHLLPVYYLPPHQIEVSGFLSSLDSKSPYPEARSQVGRFWRTGPFRTKFIAEAVWDLKESLQTVGSGLVVRVGKAEEVVQAVVSGLEGHGEVEGVWMTKGIATEEMAEERAVERIAKELGIEFQIWEDTSYLIHHSDLSTPPKELSDIFTSFRKSVEPLRDNVRPPLATPEQLPPLPTLIPPQVEPFVAPGTLTDLISRLQMPLKDMGVTIPTNMPDGATTAHPFRGGEKTAHDRLEHLIQSGIMTSYKDTRNGLIGTDYSTKLSAWLGLGCITARQIHLAMYTFEEGSSHHGAPGQGCGENKGTAAVRFELLWRDYMALCALKFGTDLFRIGGFRHSGQGRQYDERRWASLTDKPDIFRRWQEGTTGLGLIDASQRELLLTGYTSNRTRQNVACFLTKDLGIDWRLGAEWYESLLVDYEVASNWGNWQYNSGVGNDPRGEGRRFNPVKQANDYDKGAKYCRMWLPELREAQGDEGVWQAWTLPKAEKERLGIVGLNWVEKPLKQIPWGKSKGRGGEAREGHRGQNRVRARR